MRRLKFLLFAEILFLSLSYGDVCPEKILENVKGTIIAHVKNQKHIDASFALSTLKDLASGTQSREVFEQKIQALLQVAEDGMAPQQQRKSAIDGIAALGKLSMELPLKGCLHYPAQICAAPEGIERGKSALLAIQKLNYFKGSLKDIVKAQEKILFTLVQHREKMQSYFTESFDSSSFYDVVEEMDRFLESLRAQPRARLESVSWYRSLFNYLSKYGTLPVQESARRITIILHQEFVRLSSEHNGHTGALIFPQRPEPTPAVQIPN